MGQLSQTPPQDNVVPVGIGLGLSVFVFEGFGGCQRKFGYSNITIKLLVFRIFAEIPNRDGGPQVTLFSPRINEFIFVTKSGPSCFLFCSLTDPTDCGWGHIGVTANAGRFPESAGPIRGRLSGWPHLWRGRQSSGP